MKYLSIVYLSKLSRLVLLTLNLVLNEIGDEGTIELGKSCDNLTNLSYLSIILGYN